MDTLVLASFSTLSVSAFIFHRFVNKSKEEGEKDKEECEKLCGKEKKEEAKFRSLQRKFFGAYFFALFGDWLQGPYIYQLYSYYGFSESQNALLFLTGYASSSTFGTFTGPLADKYGRKRLAMVFCGLYGLCCGIKTFRNFYILLAGRVLGGISTSLLFSVFESWYVKQHLDVLKLDASLLSRTFSTSTFANGLLAIAAGVTANFFAQTLSLGPLSPFLLAVPCFLACFVVVLLTWDENHGDKDTDLWQAYKDGLGLIFADRRVLYLGLVQSIVESCMYIFVFLWTPVLSDGSGSTPLGLIFSTFMVCIMLGSTFFSYLLSSTSGATSTATPRTPADTLFLTTVLSSAALAACSFTARPAASLPLRSASFAAFLLLEFAVGLYFPSIGTLRGRHIPESHRATVTNWYRVPMNLITCLSLLALNHEAVAEDKRSLFGLCTGLLVTGIFVSAKFRAMVKEGKEKRQ